MHHFEGENTKKFSGRTKLTRSSADADGPRDAFCQS